jgi:hypothetical protein
VTVTDAADLDRAQASVSAAEKAHARAADDLAKATRDPVWAHVHGTTIHDLRVKEQQTRDQLSRAQATLDSVQPAQTSPGPVPDIELVPDSVDHPPYQNPDEYDEPYVYDQGSVRPGEASDDEDVDHPPEATAPEPSRSLFEMLVNRVTAFAPFAALLRREEQEEQKREWLRAFSPRLWWVLLGITLAVVVAAGIIAFAGSGDGDGGKGGGGQGGGGGEVASAPVYVPRVVDPSSLAGDLAVVAVPSTFTTDPISGLQGQLATAYNDNGLLVKQDGFLFHNGLNPAAEDSWPKGVEGSFNFGVAYFDSHHGALAVNAASEDNLLGGGLHQLKLPPNLTGKGIAAFEPAQPRGAGLVTQIWYWVRGNAFLAIAGTGKLPLGASRPDQRALFEQLDGALRPEEPEPGPPLTETEAAAAYTDGVAAVNAAAPSFRTDAQSWTPATTNDQAVATAKRLVTALDEVERRLADVRGRYRPAHREQDHVIANVEVVKGDLADLTRLDRIGVAAWLARYDGDIGRLTTASNALRTKLGLHETRT